MAAILATIFNNDTLPSKAITMVLTLSCRAHLSLFIKNKVIKKIHNILQEILQPSRCAQDKNVHKNT